MPDTARHQVPDVQAGQDSRGARRTLLVALALAAVTLLAYWRAGQCGFVSLDDDAYVETQPLVNQGLRSAGVAWAFAGSHGNNWHPLTSLSHILDCELFGLRAAPMHWENVLWHALASVLVLGAWLALTGALWRSAIVAAIFALHPLHVESVAWISERKDVLHAGFWLLGLWAYASWAKQPSRGKYALVLLALVLALLSKPMAVTFPCTLLLLDFWPLRRWPERRFRALLVEKLPHFALAAVLGAVTFAVQRSTGAANYGERFTLGERAANAFVSYLRYAGKTLWPQSLSPLYLHPGKWPILLVTGGVLFVLGASALAWRWRRTRPWLAFGWLWFLGTLVPVIGIVQVGAQSMADRYMYVPLLGLATIAVWGGAELASWRPKLRVPLLAAAAALLAACGIATARQVSAWKSSIALYERSIAAGEDNAAIRYLLAIAYQNAGRSEVEIVAQLHAALALRPDYVNALTQLANLELAHDRWDEAKALIGRTVKLEPANPNLHVNFATVLLQHAEPDAALREFELALALDPRCAKAHAELGQLFLDLDRMEEGRAHFEAAARLLPWDAPAQCDYGTLLCNTGRLAESLPFLERAVWIDPTFERAWQNLEGVRGALQRGPQRN